MTTSELFRSNSGKPGLLRPPVPQSEPGRFPTIDTWFWEKLRIGAQPPQESPSRLCGGIPDIFEARVLGVAVQRRREFSEQPDFLEYGVASLIYLFRVGV